MGVCYSHADNIKCITRRPTIRKWVYFIENVNQFSIKIQLPAAHYEQQIYRSCLYGPLQAIYIFPPDPVHYFRFFLWLSKQNVTPSIKDNPYQNCISLAQKSTPNVKFYP